MYFLPLFASHDHTSRHEFGILQKLPTLQIFSTGNLEIWLITSGKLDVLREVRFLRRKMYFLPLFASHDNISRHEFGIPQKLPTLQIFSTENLEIWLIIK